jgi:hypothetical protein
MNKHETPMTRPPLETLAGINPACELYAQKGQNNLSVRKTSGKDGIRYLHCRSCNTRICSPYTEMANDRR